MTNQPSPVLTAEERRIIELVRQQFYAESKSHGVSSAWSSTSKYRAETLDRLLSRTADPDTVTLPREVAASLALAAAVGAQHWEDPEHEKEIWDDIEAAKQALAIHQAQGGD